MKKNWIYLFFLAIVIFVQLNGSDSKKKEGSDSFPPYQQKMGYISYKTTNIGDDIQSIAAREFFSGKRVPIDREFISEFIHSSTIPTIVNGWFMHLNDKVSLHTFHQTVPGKAWPPSPVIDPLIISIHITESAKKGILTHEGIEYFKDHSPIGARDYATVDLLEKSGIPSYFSGCLTLTLENPLENNRQDVIYTVDVSSECVEHIKSKTRSKVVELTHKVPDQFANNHEKRLQYAESILNKYRTAKCVITNRLHAAMPCLAFKTPVLFLGTSCTRFDGLAELTHHCSERELLSGKITFDINNPLPNPDDYLEIRNSLIETVTSWVESKKTKSKNHKT